MTEYLLRLEAVNFAATCFDTNELSTIRGGSMMLANAHDLIGELIPSELKNGLEFTGASHSVWKFDAKSLRDAQEVAEKFLKALASHETLRHGTFVCNVRQYEDDVRTLQDLRMLNHWSQFQKPTIANPILDPVKSTNGTYCEFDRIRPASREIHKGDVFHVSQSTFDKRNYGRDQKKTFYHGVKESLRVVNDLQELTCHSDPNHRLNGKMAIIYIDGNKQSEVAYTRSIEENKSFRKLLKEYHEAYLSQLVGIASECSCEAGKSNDWFFWDNREDQHQLRIETLLWGGDDIVLVVPAWQGLFTVRYFFDLSNKWLYNKAPLTHSAGIVFCNAKTPVQHMVRLADDLVIQCKKQSKNDVYDDMIAYEVLESFDNIESDIDSAWSRRISNDPNSSVAKELVLGPDYLNRICALIREVRKKIEESESKISRSKIETLVRQMPHIPPADADFDKLISAAFNSIETWNSIVDRNERSKLLHLVSLWDYLG